MQLSAPQSASLFQAVSLPQTAVPLRHTLLLVSLAALLLVMPVSYRAGTEVAHPHAVFQGWIDAADGSAGHHHHPESTATHRAAGRDHAEHSAARWAAGQDGIAAGGPAAEADTPTLSALKAPLSSAMPLLALAGVLLLLVISAAWRPLWAASASLLGAFSSPEAPPPRPLLPGC
jgi:hypothetical protein